MFSRYQLVPYTTPATPSRIQRTWTTRELNLDKMAEKTADNTEIRQANMAPIKIGSDSNGIETRTPRSPAMKMDSSAHGLRDFLSILNCFT